MATDPLSLVFIACFLFGLLFLVISAALGSLSHSGHAGATGHTAHTIGHVGHTVTAHVHAGQGAHIIHHAPSQQIRGAGTQNAASNASLLSYVNPTSIVLFLLGFGFFGYILHTATSFVLPLTLVLALVAGCVVAALLLAFISRVFGDSEGATVQDVADRSGLLGKVSSTIQENGLGEVIYVSPGGMRKRIAARSIDGKRIERGQEVVVLNYAGGIAEVDLWEHFVNQDQADSFDMPDAEEMSNLRALLEEPQGTASEILLRKDMQKE